MLNGRLMGAQGFRGACFLWWGTDCSPAHGAAQQAAEQAEGPEGQGIEHAH